MTPAIEIENLTCRFGAVEAVRNLSLQVPQGSIYAFLGTNGAGKTTTIRTLMNLNAPSSGHAKVFGVPSDHLSPADLGRIGYVSENQQIPERLTVQQLVDYCRALYPTWDDAFCLRLQELLALPAHRKISGFSRGMKMKAALLVSLAYRPRLLVMDEPFSGLDPLVRDELITALLELFDQADWTVFLSSHDIDEVERLADWVGIVDRGQLCVSDSVENLRGRFRRIDAVSPNGTIDPGAVPQGALLPEVAGGSARWIVSRFAGDDALASLIGIRFPQGTAFTSTPLALREIFVAVTRHLRTASSIV